MRRSGKRWLSPLLAVGAAAQVVIAAQQAPAFKVERRVVTDAAGQHRLAVDVGLLAGASPFAGLEPVDAREGRQWRAYGGLSDLRLYDASNREVPYLLVHPPAAAARFVNTTLLPVAETEKTSGFEADLGSAQMVDAIQVEGLPAPFLKRLVLEGSGDRERWTLLAGEGTLFDLPQERLRQRTLPFLAGSYRYLRVTWDDTNSGRLPMPSVVFARLAPAAPVPAVPLVAYAPVESRTGEAGRSRYRVRLPAARLPIVSLRLDVAGGHVFRQATVVESTVQGGRSVPRTIGRAMLSRVVRDGITAEDLRIPISAPNEAVVDVIIEDGSNPPLALNGVRLEFAELPWIYFESPGGTLTAKYGAPSLPAPRYDLEAARDAIRIEEVKDARWAEVAPQTSAAVPAPSPAMPEAGAAVDVRAFRYKRALPAGPAGLVVLPLDAAVLAHSRGPGPSFGDIRIVDGDKQIPYLVERLEEPLTMDLEVRPYQPNAPTLVSRPGNNLTVYTVELPYADLPQPQLSLETSARVFNRKVRIGRDRPADRRNRNPWFEGLARSEWIHADQGSAAPTLTLAFQPPPERQLLIVVDEGDNAPLPISRARLLLPSYRLRFYHPGRPLTLMYNREYLTTPTYDLELLAPQLMGADATVITMGPEESATPTVTSLVTPRLFWIGLGVAVLVLVGLIARLMRSAPSA